jgi:hypothetical protein
MMIVMLFRISNTVSKWGGKLKLAVVFDTLHDILQQANVSHCKGSDRPQNLFILLFVTQSRCSAKYPVLEIHLNTVSKWGGKLKLAVVFDTLPDILQQANISHCKGSD